MLVQDLLPLEMETPRLHPVPPPAATAPAPVTNTPARFVCDPLPGLSGLPVSTRAKAPAPSTETRLPSVVRAALRSVPPPKSRVVDSPSGEYPDFSQSACRDSGDEELFFPEDGRSGDSAAARRRYCSKCPLQAECMTWALRNEMAGTWGLTEWERMALGGAGIRHYPRSPVAAAATAIRDGIDPDALAAALIAVHGAAPAAAAPARRARTA